MTIESALFEARNRIASSIRQMLVPSNSDVNLEPYIFMHGNPIDLSVLQIASSLITEMEADMIYVQFEPGEAVMRPRSIVVIVSRAHAFHVVRDCDLWVDPTGNHAAVVPALHAGHLICDGEEIVHLPGKPSKMSRRESLAHARRCCTARAR